MTNVGLRIAPLADGSHVQVAIFIVNNRPETTERIRPHVKVGSSHDAAAGRGAPCASVAVPGQRGTAPPLFPPHRGRGTGGPRGGPGARPAMTEAGAPGAHLPLSKHPN